MIAPARNNVRNYSEFLMSDESMQMELQTITQKPVTI